jgi:hypothetical protein
MTASHVSEKANRRSLTFAGVLNDVLTEMGHEVVWSDPEISPTKSALDKFDAVLVGVTPITSLSAIKAYGALSTINTLWGSDKLFLFIDAPTVSQIGVSLKSAVSSPDSLVKPFFSYRKNYAEVSTNAVLKDSVMSAVEKLYTQNWPKTLYPALPWKSDKDVYNLLPNTVGDCLVGIHSDAFLLESSNSEPIERVDKWVYDTPTPHWTKKLLKTVALPGSPMKINKGSTDVDVAQQISRSVGVLLSPERRQGTWWSYRYAQSMNLQTPVVTEWKESHIIGSSWSVLAASVEEMTVADRTKMSRSQKTEYLNAIPSKLEVTKTLYETMNL